MRLSDSICSLDNELSLRATGERPNAYHIHRRGLSVPPNLQAEVVLKSSSPVRPFASRQVALGD